jgi:hypothetical protein
MFFSSNLVEKIPEFSMTKKDKSWPCGKTSKKTRIDIFDPGIALYILRTFGMTSFRKNIPVRAGLLTPPFFRRLPIPISGNSDILILMKPFLNMHLKGGGHSGGPVPDFHRVPYYAQKEHPNMIYINQNNELVQTNQGPPSPQGHTPIKHPE